jgi:hypothetical protein
MRLTSPKEKRKPQRDLRCIMVVLNQRDTEEAEDQDRCDNEGLEPEHVIAWHREKERGKKKGKKKPAVIFYVEYVFYNVGRTMIIEKRDFLLLYYYHSL